MPKGKNCYVATFLGRKQTHANEQRVTQNQRKNRSKNDLAEAQFRPDPAIGDPDGASFARSARTGKTAHVTEKSCIPYIKHTVCDINAIRSFLFLYNVGTKSRENLDERLHRQSARNPETITALATSPNAGECTPLG